MQRQQPRHRETPAPRSVHGAMHSTSVAQSLSGAARASRSARAKRCAAACRARSRNTCAELEPAAFGARAARRPAN